MIEELQKDDLYEISLLNEVFGFVLQDVKKDLENNPFSHYLLYFDDEKLVGYLNYYLIYNRIEIANFNVLDSFQK